MKFTCCLENEIEVRPVQRSDSPELFHMLDKNRNEFFDAFPWLAEVNAPLDVENFIEQVKQQAHNQSALWCIILHAGTPVGLIAISHIDWRNSHGTLGYGLAPSHRRQGIITRISQALLDYCFGELDLHRVEIYAETLNARGRAVPERLGFTQEGVLKEAYATQEGFSDLAVYRMLEEEWQQRKSTKN